MNPATKEHAPIRCGQCGSECVEFWGRRRDATGRLSTCGNIYCSSGCADQNAILPDMFSTVECRRCAECGEVVPKDDVFWCVPSGTAVTRPTCSEQCREKYRARFKEPCANCGKPRVETWANEVNDPSPFSWRVPGHRYPDRYCSKTCCGEHYDITPVRLDPPPEPEPEKVPTCWECEKPCVERWGYRALKSPGVNNGDMTYCSSRCAVKGLTVSRFEPVRLDAPPKPEPEPEKAEECFECKAPCAERWAVEYADGSGRSERPLCSEKCARQFTSFENTAKFVRLDAPDEPEWYSGSIDRATYTSADGTAYEVSAIKYDPEPRPSLSAARLSFEQWVGKYPKPETNTTNTRKGNPMLLKTAWKLTRWGLKYAPHIVVLGGGAIAALVYADVLTLAQVGAGMDWTIAKAGAYLDQFDGTSATSAGSISGASLLAGWLARGLLAAAWGRVRGQ